ncbi:MAG: DNA glycosylase [Clostridia bacterium]|nr:DNA glycosylase [Clostridia bacterium]
MQYKIKKDNIEVNSLEEFNPEHIFECGQVFSYKKINKNCYIFYPKNSVYLIYKEEKEKKEEKEEKEEIYIIQQIGGEENIEDAAELFDLETDYQEIKEGILSLIKRKDFKLDKNVIKKAMEFGYGIRILNQDFFEIIISFIFSQNNNIKRIKSSLDRLREELGNEIKLDLSKIKNKGLKEILKDEKFYSFPEQEAFLNKDEKYFKSIGAGYRANYLVKFFKDIKNLDLDEMPFQDSKDLRDDLIKLNGIGRKVADCILLFGLDRKDVFPVDTWICKIYNDLTCENVKNIATNISNILEEEFGELSGYIQQYLFYFKRTLG